MGRVLQIRVSASTFDEREVADRWPALCRLAFAELPEGAPRGVLELVEHLADRQRIGLLDGKAVEALGEKAGRAAELKSELEQALADWNAREANALSERIEDLLDDLEKAAKMV